MRGESSQSDLLDSGVPIPLRQRQTRGSLADADRNVPIFQVACPTPALRQELKRCFRIILVERGADELQAQKRL